MIKEECRHCFFSLIILPSLSFLLFRELHIVVGLIGLTNAYAVLDFVTVGAFGAFPFPYNWHRVFAIAIVKSSARVACN